MTRENKEEITEILIAGDYAKISLRLHPNTGIEIIWWVIEVLGEKIEIRDQDYCDLRDLIYRLDKNPNIYQRKMQKLRNMFWNRKK